MTDAEKLERYSRDCDAANLMLTIITSAIQAAAEQHRATPYAVMMAVAASVAATLGSVADQNKLPLEKVVEDFVTLLQDRFETAEAAMATETGRVH